MTANNLRFLLVSSLFFFLFQPILSEENIRYYDIELVVFEDIEEKSEENSESNEIWPTAKELVIPENTAILGRKFEGSLPPEYDPSLLFNSLALEDYQLKEEVQKLIESEKYRLLLHTGWRQPGLNKKIAIPVYINHAVAENAGLSGPETTETDDDTSNQVFDSTTTSGQIPETPEVATTHDIPGNAIAKLEGLVTIVLARYLHLDIEMLYKKELGSDTVDMFDSSFLEDRSNKSNVFYLQQNRRMRSKETHYIDHPKFSMLIRITPHEVISTVTPAIPKSN